MNNNEIEINFKKWFEKLSPFGRGFFIGGSIIFGTMIFFYLLFQFLFSDHKDYQEVIVFTQEFPAGEDIEEKHLAKRKFPKKYLPSSVILPKDVEFILNKKTKNNFEPGDLLRWNDIEGSESYQNHLSTKVPIGYRALHLPISQMGALKNWLKEEDKVDIIGTFVHDRAKGGRKELTKVILQNISVLTTKPQPIFLVSSRDAELLLFAQTQGTLNITLRNPQDFQSTSKIPSIEFSRLIGLKEVRRKYRKKNQPNGKPQVLSLRKK